METVLHPLTELDCDWQLSVLKDENTVLRLDKEKLCERLELLEAGQEGHGSNGLRKQLEILRDELFKTESC